MLTLDLNRLALLRLSISVRNRRSAQGDRLSAITMALQYESDEEGILSGTSSPRYLRFIKHTCIHWAMMKIQMNCVIISMLSPPVFLRFCPL